MDERKQYLGFTDGELVRDLRSGTLGQVRVRDDEEVGRYAEISWSAMVCEERELAIDHGLEDVRGIVREHGVEFTEREVDRGRD